jgi:hypothetical protein
MVSYTGRLDETGNIYQTGPDNFFKTAIKTSKRIRGQKGSKKVRYEEM